MESGIKGQTGSQERAGTRHDAARSPEEPMGAALATTLLQRKIRRRVLARRGGGAAGPTAASVVAGAAGQSGAPLPVDVRGRFEGALGTDLGGVRVHTGAASAAAAEALGAQAYATGNDIHFGAGQLTPGTVEGDRVLAHELVHTVQQRGTPGACHDGAPQTRLAVSEPGDADEVEADAVAERAVAHLHHGAPPASAGLSAGASLSAPASLSGGAGAELQRKGKPAAAKPKDLTEPEVAAAMAWGQRELAPQAIGDLQAALKVPATGTYDKQTVLAVDEARSHKPHDGLRGAAPAELFEQHGLVRYGNAEAAAADAGVWKAIGPGGVTAAFLVAFEDVHGASEFRRAAEDFARRENALAVRSGTLAVGRPMEITETHELIEGMQAVHQTLVRATDAETDKSKAEPQGDASKGEASKAGAPKNEASKAGAKPDAKAAPKHPTEVRRVGIFTHGIESGLSMVGHDKKGKEVTNFLHGPRSTTAKKLPANVEALVRGLGGAVAKDVQVLLYACRTGGETPKGDDEWGMPEERERAGQGSFADHLAQALGSEALVAAHLSSGHTTENYAARIFRGNDTGGGEHFFNVIYDKGFVDDALERVVKGHNVLPGSPLKQRYREALRKEMWNHYRDCIQGEHAWQSAQDEKAGAERKLVALQKVKDKLGPAPKDQPDPHKAERKELDEKMEPLEETIAKADKTISQHKTHGHLRFGGRKVGMSMFADIAWAKEALRIDWQRWSEERVAKIQAEAEAADKPQAHKAK